MGNPVTVAVRRETTPERSADAVAWIDEGLHLARNFNGCLGGGLMRDADHDHVLHVIYTFRDEQALDEWERSVERQRWLELGESLVLDVRVQRRTGIEGWFDGPVLTRQVNERTGRARAIGVRSAPLRWKQACAIWLGMLPMNLLVGWLISMAPWWIELPLPLRAVIQVSLLAPAMTFAVMPMVTRILRPWLRRDSGFIRSERALREALDRIAIGR